MGVIRVQSICGAADTGPQGDKLYDVMSAALSRYDQIVISFDGVDTATSSFVNASFVRLLSHVSFDEIKQRLKVINSTRQINDMIKRRLTREATVAA